ncbi:unnamed protein product [Euphydryas editha]|uniref:Uncharacterized protein n=1 Tax=Euphydryas editha TaxID=104508 RepID=A0AAU9UAU6_EUPED|nr:unnamed protein product [Euphydryas editha]
MAKSKKQKSEEELERRRVARRQKYQTIKKNPELYAAEQEKKENTTLKRRKIKKLKEHEIKLKELMLPKDIATFKGTMTVHQVVWAADSAYLEFRKQSCFECLDVACKHGKHMRFFKIYNTPIESTIENVEVIPENKRIKVLSDVTIRYANTDPKLHDSAPSTSSLRSVRHSWTNKSFINNYTKATGHEKIFFDFLKKCEDNDDFPLSD